ncbi:RidA family protein [Sulfitobacter sp. PR48]|uniref:RidA family protein n=1 Tax=Sulfitobacter sp. PR48 TaxID=3028383 RepID=UPI00237B742B|nr:RidA family protein [Sulfitobacter sp. PR48]MDD9721976.1 RidA family protein [Sulfitobacter sp. PR48]
MSNAIARMNPDTLPDAGKVGYSQISITNPGRLAFVSGQVAWSADGSAVPETLEGQTSQVISNLAEALRAIAATPRDIVQMRVYMTELNDATMVIVMTQITAFLGREQPSLTGIGVASLANEDLKIEIEMVVQIPA